jgi:aminoglycoside phosphotransferase (APT) family kinase protein
MPGDDAVVKPGVEANLLQFLRSHLGDEGLDYAVPPRRFAQGMFSDVRSFALNRGPQEWTAPLVLRMLPRDAAPEQLTLETAVQNGLARLGMPAPYVLLCHDRVETLGRMFMVMERRPGGPVLRGVRWDLFARSLPKLMATWPGTVASIASDLHACDPDAVLAEAKARGLDSVHLSSERHLRFIEDRFSRLDVPGVGPSLQWLRNGQPDPPTRSSIVHGDLWPANVLQQGRRLTGVVDWERASLGDPALDIGFAKVGLTLLPAPAQVPAPIRQAIHAAGRSMATRLEELYRLGHPLPPERVEYYEALRCALELAIVAHRRANRRPDQGPSGWDQGADALSRHFFDLTGTELRVPGPAR